MRSRRQKFSSDESGGVAVVMAVMLTAILSMAALVLDLGHLATVKTEVRKAAEAGAYAGARALALPQGVTDWNWDNGKATAVATVQQNAADNHSFADFTVANVQVGYWDMKWDSRTAHDLLSSAIAPAIGHVAAVKVTVAKTNGGAGSSAPVAASFASIMGIDSMGVQASAVAMISPPTKINPGGAFPFALPYTYVDQHWKDNPPTSFTVGSAQHDSSGGQWTSFLTADNSASYVAGLITNGNPTALSVGDQVFIQNGEENAVYKDTAAQFKAYPNKIYMVAVVEDGFVNGSYTHVVAYVPYQITAVNNGSNPCVTGHFVPGYVDQKASGAGGKYFGDPMPPKLVQ